MSKTRVMGAGSAGSTIHHCNVNLNTAGGNKKQGLPFLLDRRTFQHKTVKIKATGDKRDYIFTMNQIGGIGRVKWYPHDGIRPREPYQFNLFKPYQNGLNKQIIQKQTNTVLTCVSIQPPTDVEGAEIYNLYTYSVDGIYYIIVPYVSCDPFTINAIHLDHINNSIILYTNLTFVPDGPTNGYTGYVFKTDINAGDIGFYAINFNCSTMDVNTLTIQDNGSTEINIADNNINIIPGISCNNIKTILYNGTVYDTTLCIYDRDAVATYIYINQNLGETILNGSVQCNSVYS